MIKPLANLGLFILALPLAACSEKVPPSNKVINSPEIQALKQQVLNDLVFIEGGSFIMGDAGYVDEQGVKHYWSPDADDKVTRKVTLSSYSIQKFENTFAQMDTWTTAKGIKQIYAHARNSASMQPDHPAEGMTWLEARDYCLFLAELTGYPFSLPTEAQWEFAARSRGLNVAYATDDGTFVEGKNVKDTSQGNSVTLPPGSLPPNPLGIYDMTGNVGEWVLDWYTRKYPYEDQVNPTGPSEEEYQKWQFQHKVTRGGGLAGGDDNTVYRRTENKPTNNGAGNGIRCVVNYPKPISPAHDGAE